MVRARTEATVHTLEQAEALGTQVAAMLVNAGARKAVPAVAPTA